MPVSALPTTALLLEVSHVAHRLRVCPEFVRREIRAGRLPAIRLGTRHYRIDSSDLQRYIHDRRTPAPVSTPVAHVGWSVGRGGRNV